MADDFTRDKLKWLAQVAHDGGLPASAVRLAIVLATRFMNRRTGDAWPSVGTLRDALELSERQVQASLGAMVERSHMRREIGGGRGKSSRYAWIIQQPKPREKLRGNDDVKPRDNLHPFKNKPRSLPHETPQFCADKPRRKLHPNPFEENPNEEPIESLCESDGIPNFLGEVEKPARKEIKADPIASFEEFWTQYPRRVSRGQAVRAYAAAIKSGASPGQLLEGAMRYSAERTGQPERYTKHPGTWLTGKCWLDELAAPEEPRALHHFTPTQSRPMSRLEQVLARQEGEQ